MLLREILGILDSISPFEAQESWDNSGLIIGNPNSEISEISLCLEATKQIAHEVREDSLLITHHPLIFSPLKRLDFSAYPSNIIEILVKKNVSLIAMHTNFDATHLNAYFAREMLGFDDYENRGIALVARKNIAFDDLVESVSQKLNTTLKFTKACENISRIAIICGSGMGEVGGIAGDFECIITGDVKYHDAMKYHSLGVSIIDVGHYQSERFFGEILGAHLKKIPCNVIMRHSHNPFSFIVRNDDE